MGERAYGRATYFWTITGPAAPHTSLVLVGEAGVRSTFDQLLHGASMVKDVDLAWHVGVQKNEL